MNIFILHCHFCVCVSRVYIRRDNDNDDECLTTLSSALNVQLVQTLLFVPFLFLKAIFICVRPLLSLVSLCPVKFFYPFCWTVELIIKMYNKTYFYAFHVWIERHFTRMVGSETLIWVVKIFFKWESIKVDPRQVFYRDANKNLTDYEVSFRINFFFLLWW